MRCAALAFMLIACPIPDLLAADINAEAPGYRPATALSYDWSGYYGGPNVGGAWGHAASSLQAGAPPAFPTANAFDPHQPALTPNAFAGGVQVGHNWLRGQWLFGFEADVNYLGLTKSSNFGASLLSSTVATVRPRVGYVSGSWMVYGTGGLALATSQLGDGATAGNAAAFSSSASETRVGWTLGAGTEWVVVPNLTTKVEYFYVDLGKADANAASTGRLGGVPSPSASFGSRLTDNIIRFGLNYKFNK